MNIITSPSGLSDNEPRVLHVNESEASTNARTAPTSAHQVATRRQAASEGAIGEPIIGTVEQWVCLSAADRRTVELLDKRVSCGRSNNEIREFFSNGQGIHFPAWVRENFLGRVPVGSAVERPGPLEAEPDSTARPTGEVEADPKGQPATAAAVLSKEPIATRNPTSRSRPSPNASVVYFPAPTLILRTACFRGVKGKNHRQRKYMPIAALDGINLVGKGHLLSALDLIPWLAAVKLVRGKKTSDVVKIKLGDLLKAMDRPDGTRSRRLLRKQLTRIGRFKIKLNAMWGMKNTAYTGALLRNFKILKSKCGKKVEFECSVSAELLRVFEAGETYLKLHDLRRLSQRPLCLWLWGFYIGHDRPFPMFVKTIKHLSGFEEKTFEFRRQLKEGLQYLKTQGLIADWGFDKKTDKVRVIHLRGKDKLAR